MSVPADTHLFGSRRGYQALAKSAGVSKAEDNALSEFGFGQSSDPAFLKGLATEPTAFGRRLPSGRIAITRVLAGPLDEAGRPTLERRTLLFSEHDYHKVRTDLPALVSNGGLWSASEFQSGRRLSVQASELGPLSPTVAEWRLLDAWISAKARPPHGVIAGSESASTVSVLRLAGCLADSDALTYSWGVRLLGPIAWVDAMTLSPHGSNDGRRPLFGVARGDCVNDMVRRAMASAPQRMPPVGAMREVEIVGFDDGLPHSSHARSGRGTTRLSLSQKTRALAVAASASVVIAALAMVMFMVWRTPTGSGGAELLSRASAGDSGPSAAGSSAINPPGPELGVPAENESVVAGADSGSTTPNDPPPSGQDSLPKSPKPPQPPLSPPMSDGSGTIEGADAPPARPKSQQSATAVSVGPALESGNLPGANDLVTPPPDCEELDHNTAVRLKQLERLEALKNAFRDSISLISEYRTMARAGSGQSQGVIDGERLQEIAQRFNWTDLAELHAIMLEMAKTNAFFKIQRNPGGNTVAALSLWIDSDSFRDRAKTRANAAAVLECALVVDIARCVKLPPRWREQFETWKKDVELWRSMKERLLSSAIERNGDTATARRDLQEAETWCARTSMIDELVDVKMWGVQASSVESILPRSESDNSSDVWQLLQKWLRQLDVLKPDAVSIGPESQYHCWQSHLETVQRLLVPTGSR